MPILLWHGNVQRQPSSLGLVSTAGKQSGISRDSSYSDLGESAPSTSKAPLEKQSKGMSKERLTNRTNWAAIWPHWMSKVLAST